MGDFAFPVHVKASVVFSDLLHCMLVVEPERRITIAEIQAHPWYLCMLPEGVAAANDNCIVLPYNAQVKIVIPCLPHSIMIIPSHFS